MTRRGRARAALAALMLPLAACAGPARQVCRDLELFFEREGEGRAAVSALAFTPDGQRVVVGDFRGGLELLDPRTGAATALPAREGAGEVLAVGRLLEAGGQITAVHRSGEPFGWSRLTGAIASSDGRFAGWSRIVRRLWSAGPGGASAAADVLAAAFSMDGLLVLAGRPGAPARLEARGFPDLEERWSVELERAASALAADEAAGVLIVADDAGLELRALADGALRHRLDAPASTPIPLRDGRRVLLVQEEWVCVLDLAADAGGREPRLEPGFLAHRGGVTAVAVSDDGTRLATGGARGDVRVYRVLPITPSFAGDAP